MFWAITGFVKNIFTWLIRTNMKNTRACGNAYGKPGGYKIYLNQTLTTKNMDTTEFVNKSIEGISIMPRVLLSVLVIALVGCVGLLYNVWMKLFHLAKDTRHNEQLCRACRESMNKNQTGKK
jgi:hypothetical protein